MSVLLALLGHLLVNGLASRSAVPLDPAAQQILERQAPELLREYRVPEPGDRSGDWASSPKAYEAHADFTGDGAEDVALILVRRKGPGFALVVLLDARGAAPFVEVLEKRKWPAQGFGVAVAKLGRYRTAAGKGYNTPAGDPLEIVLEHPAIDRFHFESWNGFWFWDQRARRFRYIQMSD